MDFKLNNVVSMWKVREMVDKATNLVMNYTETESKVKNNQDCLKPKILIFRTNESSREYFLISNTFLGS